jgi:hypothetical protein
VSEAQWYSAEEVCAAIRAQMPPHGIVELQWPGPCDCGHERMFHVPGAVYQADCETCRVCSDLPARHLRRAK